MKRPSKFTDKYIAGLKPVDTRIDLWEPGRTGLGIRINVGGTKTWFCRYTLEGTQRRMVLGRYPGLSLAQARQQLGAAQEAVVKGTDPAPNAREKAQAEKDAETVFELADFYLKTYAQERLAPKTVAEQERILRADILPAWGKRKAKNITRRDVSVLLLALRDRARGRRRDSNGRAADIARSLLNKMFEVGFEHGLVDDNPVAGLSQLTKTAAKDRVFTLAEIRVFWRGLPRSGMTRPVQQALKFQLATGQRIGAVLLATWREFDLNANTWTIPAGEGRKNKSDNTIPLSPLAQALLRHIRLLHPEGDYLFPSTRGKTPHLRTDSVNTATDRAQEALGLDRWTTHDLRRSALTGLIRGGTQEALVARIAGHAPSTVLSKHYDQHDHLEPMRRALDAWGSEIIRLARGCPEQSNVVRLQAMGG